MLRDQIEGDDLVAVGQKLANMHAIAATHINDTARCRNCLTNQLLGALELHQPLAPTQPQRLVAGAKVLDEARGLDAACQRGSCASMLDENDAVRQIAVSHAIAVLRRTPEDVRILSADGFTGLNQPTLEFIADFLRTPMAPEESVARAIDTLNMWPGPPTFWSNLSSPTSSADLLDLLGCPGVPFGGAQ